MKIKITLLIMFAFSVAMGVLALKYAKTLEPVIYSITIGHIDKIKLDVVYNEKVVETMTDDVELEDMTEEDDLDTEQVELLEYIIQDIEYINQVDDYPTGCESVAAVMALNFMGIDITVDSFIDDYLDRGNSPYYVGNTLYACDPWEAFVGNPRSSNGYGCYSTVIENAINKFINTDEYKVYVYNEFTSQISLEQICEEFINQDIPVLIWATASMASVRNSTLWTIEDTDDKFQWISPMHCLLLVGYDEDYYYFHDSLQDEYTKYSKTSVETAYEDMGSQALAILN